MLFRSGARVAAGQVLVELKNPQLQRHLREIEDERELLGLRARSLESLQVVDPTAAGDLLTTREMLADVTRRRAVLLEETRQLRIVTPIAGTVIGPAIEHGHPVTRLELSGWQGTPLDSANTGAFLESGRLVCLVGDPRDVECVLTIDQQDIEFVRRGQSVTLSLAQSQGQVLTGTIEDVSQVDPLSQHGPLSDLRAVDTATALPVTTTYRARVRFSNGSPELLIRGTGRACIWVPPQSLASRVYRWLRETFRVV